MTRTLHNHWHRLLWLIWPLIFTIWASYAPATDLRTIALSATWGVALLYAVPPLSAPVRLFRRIPALLWLLWLAGLVAVIGAWLVRFQPAIGLAITITEQLWLVGCLSALLLLPFAGQSSTEDVRLGWIAGPLITLTTLVLIVISIELGLRYVWVMSDNFQFSKMHQNWQRLHWQPINEMGYRDDPIPATDEPLTHILVMGDSLVTGYGVDDIGDTFPQQLEAQLGAGYGVNIVAQPGWGVASAFGAVQDYPTMPDILILSHYINDITEGTAAQQYNQSFPPIRIDPTAAQSWWTDRFYIANFLYYRVFLYTQYDSLGVYNDWVYGAYADAQVWRAYQEELQAIIDWTSTNEIALVVLVWPDIVNIEPSQAITAPIADFFQQQNVTVVEMASLLHELPVGQRVVNPFDAHPSAQAHQLAADAIAPMLPDS